MLINAYQGSIITTITVENYRQTSSTNNLLCVVWDFKLAHSLSSDTYSDILIYQNKVKAFVYGRSAPWSIHPR